MRIRHFILFTAILALSHPSWAKQNPVLRLSVINPFFSPNKDGLNDVLAMTVIARGFKKVSNWEYRVEDSVGVIRRSVAGVNTAPSLLVWDGMDDYGAPLAEGNYKISFVLWDTKLGIFSAENILVTIDMTPPAVSFSLEKRAANEDAGIPLLFSAVDLSGVQSWKFEAKDFLDSAVFVKASSDPVPSNFLWTPTNDVKNLLRVVGLLTATDNAGNRGQSAPVQILLGKAVPAEKPAAPVPVIKKYLQATTIISIADLFGTKAGRTSFLTAQAGALLTPLAQVLDANPGSRAVILGHVDAQANEQDAQSLSSYFAWKVYSFFIKHRGADKTNVSVKGLGNNVRLAKENIPLGRARNRRIEIQIFVPEASAK